MHLDLPTLLWTLTLTSGVLAAAVLAVARRAKVHQGLALWGLGLVVNALSYPSFGLRVLGWTALSIIVTNLLTVLTLALHTQALRAFQKGRAHSLPDWALWTPVVLNVLAATVFVHDDHWRNILASGLQTVLAMLLWSQAWGPGLQGRRLTGRMVVLTGVSVLVLMFLIRTLFMAWQADWDGHYNVPHQVQVATYLTTLVVLLLNSMGFVLMQMEHAIAQQHNLATHDGLTGVYNRHAMIDTLERYSAHSSRNGTPMALLMLDIDHFKSVNDQHGHLAGDEVLKEVARRAQRRLRRADMLARYGGEEFLALLPGTDSGGASVVADAIRRAIEAQPVHVHGQPVRVTVSVGVHAAVPDGTDEGNEAMVARCDQALYQAKDRGRNRVVVI